jgi:hypothetical protein
LPVLHGLDAPPGDGMVIEVHLDMMQPTALFLERLHNLGFEDDPFLDFYPPEYHFHFTGRSRALQSELRTVLPGIESLAAQVIQEARDSDVKLYAEVELVRDIQHFESENTARDLSALEAVTFNLSPEPLQIKADIHVEFRAGTVPNNVRDLLLKKGFYWVRTPESERFPSEEIATAQTSAFEDARQVYHRLVASPLPGCTGIHLEQKVAMIASFPGLPMPHALELAKKTPLRDNDLLDLAFVPGASE